MKRKILLLAVRFIVSISLVLFLLFNLGKENLFGLPGYLNNASYELLAFPILAFFAAIALGAVRWGKLLEIQGIKFAFFPLLQLTLISNFFSNFLPGLVGGDAVKLFYATRKNRKTAGILASILLDRIMGVAALLLIAVFALPFSFNVPEIEKISLFVCILFILFIIGVFLFFNLKSSPILKRIYKISIFDLGNKIKTFKNSVVLYRNKKRILAYAFTMALVIQFFMVIGCYFVSLFFNFNIPLRYFLVFIPIIQLITFLPITVGGIGMREWSFVLFFTTASGLVVKMDAFALSIGFYIAVLFSSLPGGIVYLLMGGEIRR
ncbi:MAG: lysylphosphatidylglycerol synthase transmembrane domain-containing protein [Candidatus Ratteibacteria bacterium]|nr:lysylphosphatidylglycerol synthase transmembrane domain-containing protein [Candidatus Ratteibacteria bacterium]